MKSIRIEIDVPVEMRDGTVLRADVYRPAEPGPRPVLLQRTPYGKSQPINVVIFDTWAALRRGYIVVHQDTRGRNASDGEWLPWEFEQDDGYDTVEWASRIEGSNGKVAMFGASYTGNTQWMAAIAQPPHLVAIAPQVTWCEPYDGLFARGGASEIGLNLAWSLVQSLRQLPKVVTAPDELGAAMTSIVRDLDEIVDRTYWELPSTDSPALARTGLPDVGLQRDLRDPTTSDRCRVNGHHGEVTVPSLNIAGWFDVFQQGTIDNFVAARDAGQSTRLIIGPWRHTSVSGFLTGGQNGDVNFGVAANLIPGSRTGTLTDVQLDWFDRWTDDDAGRRGVESGVEIFVMGINRWRAEETWPLERARDTALYLHEDGGLAFSAPEQDAAPSVYRYDPADPTPTTGGAVLMTPEHPAGPLKQSQVERRSDVLVFTSDVLEHDLEVTGRISARLFASTDGPSTDWVVRLCDVDAHGESTNVVDGVLRAQTSPGLPTEYSIDLWSTSMVFKAGHRLRVQVTSSNFPRWDRNLNTGIANTEGTQMRVARQEIFHDRSRPSHLILPVVDAPDPTSTGGR